MVTSTIKINKAELGIENNMIYSVCVSALNRLSRRGLSETLGRKRCLRRRRGPEDWQGHRKERKDLGRGLSRHSAEGQGEAHGSSLSLPDGDSPALLGGDHGEGCQEHQEHRGPSLTPRTAQRRRGVTQKPSVLSARRSFIWQWPWC